MQARLPESEIPVAVPVYSEGCCWEPRGAQGAGRLRATERPGDVGADSAGLASSSVGKWGSRRYEGESCGAGDPGQPRALSSEGTGLGQRPSPGKYRMHFFFLLGIVKRVICKQRVNSQSYTTTKDTVLAQA